MTNLISNEPTTGVSIILPAYNEADGLPVVLTELYSVLDPGYDVIVVDDGSADGTAEIARRFPCRLIQHSENRGKGAAVRTGLEAARGEAVIVIDADGTYPVAAIPTLVELLTEADIVRANRPRGAQAMPLINRIGNAIFNRLLSFSHGLDGSDHLSGLYGIRRDALTRLRLESEGFDIEAEIGIKARVGGMRVRSVDIPYHPRLGEKKLRPWRDGVLILGRILALFLLYNPLVTFVVPGVLVMAAAVGIAFLVSNGPFQTPFFGLDIHSYIVAVLGTLASFQLIVFGVAAALYGVESGGRPPGWLLALSARPVRLTAAGTGLLLLAVSVVRILLLANRWIADGAGLFFGTRDVVLAATFLVFGMQLLSAALFLSIFAGRLDRYRAVR
jgi:glycosyltransferase involved in cell wall biosynthesis